MAIGYNLAIDYKLAVRAIGNAMNSVCSELELILAGGNGNRQQPAFAFAGGPSSPELYKPRAGNAPTLDAYLRHSNGATKPVTDVPPAKYFLQQLYG